MNVQIRFVNVSRYGKYIAKFKIAEKCCTLQNRMYIKQNGIVLLNLKQQKFIEFNNTDLKEFNKNLKMYTTF